MRSKRKPDLLARILNSTGQFKGKARVVNLLGRLSRSKHGGQGTFPLTNGETLTVDLADRIQRLMWGGAYEPYVRKCIVTLLHPGDTFVDVGSHIGFFSSIASSLVGCSGKVFAFEADSTLFETLHSNVAEYPWTFASLNAVWNRSGPVAFSNPQQSGESGWGKLASIRDEGHITTVEAISLDDWHKSVGFPPIQLIKIDAEGSEPFILEGATRLISKTRPVLILELNEKLLREVGRSGDNIAASLRALDYRIFKIGSNSLDEVCDSIAPLSLEVLCIPVERLDETMKTLSVLRVKRH